MIQTHGTAGLSCRLFNLERTEKRPKNKTSSFAISGDNLIPSHSRGKAEELTILAIQMLQVGEKL